MQDKLWIGLLIGLISPVLGYFMIEGVLVLIDILLKSKDIYILMRESTHYLLALAFNIIAVNYMNRRYMSKNVRGIVLATLIYAGLWLWMFYSKVM